MYDTQNGKTIHVPHGAFPGDIVWTPRFGEAEDDIEFEHDTVVGVSNSTGFDDEGGYEDY